MKQGPARGSVRAPGRRARAVGHRLGGTVASAIGSLPPYQIRSVPLLWARHLWVRYLRVRRPMPPSRLRACSNGRGWRYRRRAPLSPAPLAPSAGTVRAVREPSPGDDLSSGPNPQPGKVNSAPANRFLELSNMIIGRIEAQLGHPLYLAAKRPISVLRYSARRISGISAASDPPRTSRKTSRDTGLCSTETAAKRESTLSCP